MPLSRDDLIRKMIAEGTSDDDIRATLKVYDAQQPTSAPASSSVGSTAKDVGIGVLKGAGSTLSNLAEMGSFIVPGAMPSVVAPGFQRPMFTKADELTTASNTAQRVGKVAEGVAELAVPATAAVKTGLKAIPSATAAKEGFQAVMGAAKDIPVNLAEPGDVALRIADLAQ